MPRRGNRSKGRTDSAPASPSTADAAAAVAAITPPSSSFLLTWTAAAAGSGEKHIPEYHPRHPAIAQLKSKASGAGQAESASSPPDADAATTSSPLSPPFRNPVIHDYGYESGAAPPPQPKQRQNPQTKGRKDTRAVRYTTPQPPVPPPPYTSCHNPLGSISSNDNKSMNRLPSQKERRPTAAPTSAKASDTQPWRGGRRGMKCAAGGASPQAGMFAAARALPARHAAVPSPSVPFHAALMGPPPPPWQAPLRVCAATTATPTATDGPGEAYAFTEAGLSRELLDFTTYVALTPAEHEQRELLIQTVAACAADLWPTEEEAETGRVGEHRHRPSDPSDGAVESEEDRVRLPLERDSSCPRRRLVAQRDVVLYGSYALGLSLPSSDVDMCIALGLPLSYASSTSFFTSSPDSSRIPGEVSATPTAASVKEGEEGERTDGETGTPSLEARRCSATAASPAKATTDAALLRQRRQLEALYDLADHLLLCHGACLRLEVHDQCRVPVIRLQDCRTGVSADVGVCIRLPAPPAPAPTTGASMTSTAEEGEEGNEKTAMPKRAKQTYFQLLPMEEAVRRQRAWLRPSAGTPAPLSSSPSSFSSSPLPTAASQAFTLLATMLILVTKAALRQWGLGNVFTGGVSSTALYSLVHRFIPVRHSDTTARSPAPPTDATIATSSACRTAAAAEGHTKRSVVEEEVACLSVSSPTTSLAPGISEDDEWRTIITSSSSSRRKETIAKAVGAEATAVTVSSGHETGEEAATTSGTTRSTPVPFTATDTDEDVHDDQTEMAFLEGVSVKSGDHKSNNSSRDVPPSLSLPSFAGFSMCEVRGHGGEQNALLSSRELSFDELYSSCMRLFGVSPARLLLNFWRYLSADIFLFGYDILDAFAADSPPPPSDNGRGIASRSSSLGNDAEGGTTATTTSASVIGFSSPYAELPTTAATATESEGADIAATTTEASSGLATPLYDLTAPSFRLPELLALFRCTCAKLENEIVLEGAGGGGGQCCSPAQQQRRPFSSTSSLPTMSAALAAMRRRAGFGAVSPLSVVLVDPRSLAKGKE